MTEQSHVVVTGGAGFIGSHLVDRLLADGMRVTVIDDCSTGTMRNLENALTRPGLRVIQQKVSETGDLNDLVSRAQFVYHLAAAVGVELIVESPIRAIQTNLRETEVLLAAASPHRVPVLVASTSEVYGKSQKDAFSEKDDLLIGPPHLARWSYACSKLMDEFLALAYSRERGLPVTIVRLFNTVGPRQIGQYGMVLPRFIAAAKAGKPLRVHGDGTQRRCFCYVGDTVEALVRLQNCPSARGEVYNVGTIEEITIRQLAEKVKQILGSTSAIEFVDYREAYGPGFEDMQRRRPSIDKLMGTIQFTPQTSLSQIIELTAATI